MKSETNVNLEHHLIPTVRCMSRKFTLHFPTKQAGELLKKIDCKEEKIQALLYVSIPQSINEHINVLAVNLIPIPDKHRYHFDFFFGATGGGRTC